MGKRQKKTMSALWLSRLRYDDSDDVLYTAIYVAAFLEKLPSESVNFRSWTPP